MDTRKDLKISTCGLFEGVELMVPPDSGGSRSFSGLGVGAVFRSGCRVDRGAGVLRGSRFRSDTAVESDPHAFVWGQLGVLSESGWPLRGKSDRLYVRFGVWVYAGEVGDGCGTELGDICWPAARDAVRCEDAASAAAEGSREERSTKARPSGIVGEGFFGPPEARKSLLVENLRDRLLPDLCSAAGGDVRMCS